MKWLYLTLVFALAGCSSKQPEKHNAPTQSAAVEQRFRMNLHSEPSSLDPRLVRDIPTVTTAKMFFDGLMRTNLERQILPSIAKRVVLSDDCKHYTFYLRETLWSDGRPVTAYDFEYAWKRVLSPDFPAEYAHQLFMIKNGESAKKREVPLVDVGVVAEGPLKLTVELSEPNPYFLEVAASPVAYPIPLHVELENRSWAAEQGKAFICNGPFLLEQWRHGSELKAVKNPLYWDAPAVKLDAIVLTMIEDEHTELNMYENNELDWAGSPNSSIPPEALPSLKESSEGQELHIAPVAGTFCYKFNTKVEPFDSAKMRKAFASAINRQSLIDNVLQSGQIAATSLLPPCMKENFPEESFKPNGSREASIALFEEALAEKGWTRETMPQITLFFSKSEKHHKIAQAVQQEWNDTFGIKVNLQSFEWNTFLQRLSKHEYQVGGRGFVSDISDPKTLLEIYKFTNDPDLGGNNDTQWEHPEFIRLINEATVTADSTLRANLLHKAEAILLSDMPIAPLYHSTACYLKKRYVKDVYMSELCDLDFKYAYIDANER